MMRHFSLRDSMLRRWDLSFFSLLKIGLGICMDLRGYFCLLNEVLQILKVWGSIQRSLGNCMYMGSKKPLERLVLCMKRVCNIRDLVRNYWKLQSKRLVMLDFRDCRLLVVWE